MLRVANPIGKLGEDIACKFYSNKGFSILERNFRKNYGEIDIVATKEGKYYFIEVKTISRENLELVSREIIYKPEFNVDQWKIKKLKNVIWAFISKNNIVDWQFDVCAVEVDVKSKKAKVRRIANEIL